MKPIKWILAVGAVASALLALNVSALDFGLNSGFFQTTPSGDPPWATVNIKNAGQGVEVSITVSGGNNIGSLTELYMNFDQSKDATKLQVASSMEGVSADTITRADRFKADADGFFDLRVKFEGLNAGETKTFTITSAGNNLDANDFNFFPEATRCNSLHFGLGVQ